ncbi:hypothetical protein TNIN_233941 [Trichonephila inaurata madagascariensis]|uniref:Uncharacterized protein n=1 Tax=Trichonephila inaurata madagascariensis TaxID=2747483 RepID=A0A8X6Y4K4_9ARAC|nr:hypothetical protein TNIN_233941 [Trichonephila inaurata madagascariensis]
MINESGRGLTETFEKEKESFFLFSSIDRTSQGRAIFACYFLLSIFLTSRPDSSKRRRETGFHNFMFERGLAAVWKRKDEKNMKIGFSLVFAQLKYKPKNEQFSKPLPSTWILSCC